jgi:hypothetical protein
VWKSRRRHDALRPSIVYCVCGLQPRDTAARKATAAL